MNKTGTFDVFGNKRSSLSSEYIMLHNILEKMKG